MEKHISCLFLFLLFHNCLSEQRYDPKSQGERDADTQKFTEKHQYRIRFGQKLKCMDSMDSMDCDVNAAVDTMLYFRGFHNTKMTRKMATFNTGIGEFPGYGWFFANQLTERHLRGTNDHTISPIFWNLSYQISFDDNKDVRVVSLNPKNTYKDSDGHYKVHFSNGYTSGSQWDFIGEQSAGIDTMTKQFDVNSQFGVYYTPYYTTTVGSRYEYTLKEYEVIGIGTTSKALICYTREHMNHETLMSPDFPICSRYWDQNRISATSYAGFIPAFTVGILAENEFGKNTVVTFHANVTIAKLTLEVGNCELGARMNFKSIKFYHESFPLKFIIHWAHPTFSLFQPVRIKYLNYGTDSDSDRICLAAYPTTEVGLMSCEEFKETFAWRSDFYNRFHWYEISLGDDYCLSINVDRILFIEPCSIVKDVQQWNYFFNDSRLFSYHDNLTVYKTGDNKFALADVQTAGRNIMKFNITTLDYETKGAYDAFEV